MNAQEGSNTKMNENGTSHNLSLILDFNLVQQPILDSN